MGMDDTSEKGRELLACLAEIKPFLPATLTETFRRCGRASCRCAAEGPIHPTTLLTWKEGNKTQTLHVPLNMVGLVREWVTQWRQLKDIIEKVGVEQREYLKILRAKDRK